MQHPQKIEDILAKYPFSLEDLKASQEKYWRRNQRPSNPYSTNAREPKDVVTETVTFVKPMIDNTAALPATRQQRAALTIEQKYAAWNNMAEQIAKQAIILNDANTGTYNALFAHCIGLEVGSHHFAKIPLNKGILLIGNAGVGKTFMLTLYTQFYNQLNIGLEGIKHKKVETIQNQYSLYGYLPYTKNNTFYFEELGFETNIEINKKVYSFGDILYKRFSLWEKKGTKTFICTNLSREALEQKYSSRVFSRLRGMCFIATLGGADFRPI